MFLTASNIAYYLMDRDLVTAESVVDGDFMVIEAGRRNRNFKLLREGAPGLFIKQIQNVQPEAIATLQREAAFYDMVRSRPAFSSLSRLMPSFVDYNPLTYSLIVELMPSAENLTELHLRLGEYPEEVGEMIGRGLGTYHSEVGRILNEPVNFSIFPRQIPWIMTLDPSTLSPLSQFGNAGAQLTIMLQQAPEVTQRLLAMRYEWLSDALIHGDMKWDNCLVFRNEEGERDFRIVDWELADLGDASWDVGSIFCSYLVYWIMTLPPRVEQPPRQILEGAQARLVAMQPAMRSFWKAYARRRGLSEAAAEPYLERCMRFCAARLVLSVFEHLYTAPQVSANTPALLELSREIFLDPQKAKAQVLGL